MPRTNERSSTRSNQQSRRVITPERISTIFQTQSPTSAFKQPNTRRLGRVKKDMVVTSAHCFYCFDVLAAHLEKRDPSAPDFPDDKYPLFVTWNTLHKDGSARLRGCIGNFDPLPLHSGLKDYALTSALRDRRFSPITSAELPKLSCAVSLLTEFEDGDGHLDWEVGKHGIWIEFEDASGRKRTATYLPEVASEQGWSKEEAVDSLLRKGGFSGPITNGTRNAIVLTRYQSSKTSVHYPDYLAWKGAGDKNMRN